LDSTIRTSVILMGGLAVIALVVVAFVLVIDVPFWVGLIVLAVADVVLIGWAYAKLNLRRPST